MKTRNGLWFSSCAVLLMVALVTIVEPSPSEQAAAATWSHGALHVTLPYRAPHAGAGQLTMEVLSPEDQVLGRAQAAVEVAAGSGSWQQELKLVKEMSTDDLVWQRVRYRFTYNSEKDAAIDGTESISQILRRPVVHVIGQSSYAQDGMAAVRVVATDTANHPLEGTVRIGLAGRTAPLFAGKLNRRGTTEAQFRFPAGLSGSANLHYVVETAIGSADVTQPVKLEDKVQILLTTEKPIYQPGQTIHVRALALDRASHEAAADRNLTFEVEDSRGNKVFKKATQTDRFGIASAEFTLADEVNLGTYHLRAAGSELALNVERYVLPKFKVAIEFAGEAKHGYRPGQHVTGTVRANYFFGKPVDDAEITVKGTGMDVAEFEAGSVKGKTDRDGAYHFDLTLPAYFAGRATNHGAARVLIEATVKDAAGHAETRGEPITVSESPLIVTAVPEGGTLVPNLENQVFILTSYADGKPAVADVTARFETNPAQTVTTDPGGVAVVRYRAGASIAPVKIEATDREGNRVSTSVNLESRGGTDQILLRTERAIYRAGDRITLKILSTKSRGTAYVDILREGQTVLTRDLDIVNGQAELSLAATPEMAGTLDCDAYLFSRDASVVGDHRLVFIQPSDELKIEATADAQGYKPGDDAHVRFRVTNAHGQGVQAAVGVQVVDEAVFALAEKQPGFAKVFFYLEQEAMKPRYEIHSLGMNDIVEPVVEGKAQQRDRAARALFAATEMVNTNRFETEVGRETPMAKYAEYAGRYRARFVADAGRVLSRSPEDLTKAEFRDAWGTEVRVTHPQWYARTVYLVHSAGPDKRFNTPDDLMLTMEARAKKELGAVTAGTIDVQMEHDRGPFNGMAAIEGTVVDQTGAAVGGVQVNIREIGRGRTRTATVNRDGAFSLTALAPGEYDMRVSSGTFQTNSRRIKVHARDRAVVTVKLVAGIKTEVVVAETGAPRIMRVQMGGNAMNAMVVNGPAFGGGGGGVAGGAPGGIVGGVLGGIAPAAMGMLAPRQFDAGRLVVAKDAITTVPTAAPRVRSYFPEALYINPEIITDQNGTASISIPLADSITTWRMALTASTMHGALGSGTSSLKVFQDFFVDLDVPVTLTQGDRVSIPVAVYNYASGRGDVNLRLQPEDWFALVEDTPEKTLSVDAGRVGGAQFTIEAKRIGKFKLTLAANMAGGARRADIVVREIEVVPNGREQTQVFNGRLETAAEHHIAFPQAAIDGAGKILVRLYPGPLSQVIEGMDSLLRMPYGCFEQTSSATYPNVLALDYMKRTKKLTPEVHAKAEGFIANGYQRLLTFEVAGGGFSWFGNAPANKILTSYGLMEFSDMAKVHDVDPALISRTQQWLARQQQPDGSWKPDTQFINEGATNRFNNDVTRITAYIAWSLENTGYQGQAVEKAREFLAKHIGGKLDAYTMAVLANFAVDYGKDRALTRQVMQQLLDARTEKDDQAWWNADETAVFGRGPSASIETTGLAVQALLKWGEASATAEKALKYLAAKKDANGSWGTTQATIMALRAVLLSTEKGTADVRGTLEVALNGKTVERLALTPDNNDLLHQFVFSGAAAKNGGTVVLRFDGKGGLAYQIVGRYFIPWDEKPAGEALSIKVDYDRTKLAQNDIATATATVKNNLTRNANMVMIDLGIPPGFDLLSEDLQDYKEKSAGRKSGRLEKFNLTATQAILYFDSIAAGDTVALHYRLRAKYPVRARTFQSRVYEYYAPEVNSVARPVQLEVRK